MDIVIWSSNHPDTAPSFYRYIGPYKISHWIKKHGYSAQVIDFIVHFTEEELYNATKKFVTNQTLVLALSGTFLVNHIYLKADGTRSAVPEHVIRVAKRIKKEFPKLKFVIGGYAADRIYMDGIPDVSIMSYTSSNEDIFLEYVNNLRHKTPKPIGKILQSYTDSDSNKSRLWYDTPRNVTYNIETDDFKFVKNDIIIRGETLPLDVSKGCIFSCRFCNYTHLGKKKLDYIRGMDYIKEELIYNYKNFNTTDYSILDDTFNDTIIKLSSFKDMVDTLPFKITYTAYIRADLIHKFLEMGDILRDTGLQGAVHGIESFHPYASNIIGKAWSGKHGKEFLPKLFHDIWKSKVAQQINFIIGLPKETPDDIINSIKWGADNKMYGLHFSPLGIHSPLSKNRKFYLHTIESEFGRNPEKYGFKFVENDWTNDQWTVRTAIDFHKRVMLYIKENNLNLSKLNAWQVNNVMLAGYSFDEILTNPVSKFLHSPQLKEWRNTIYKEYYKRLMEI